MAASPLKSSGARLERAAFLKKLRTCETWVNRDLLIKWILSRRSRYDKREGGLGRK